MATVASSCTQEPSPGNALHAACLKFRQAKLQVAEQPGGEGRGGEGRGGTGRKGSARRESTLNTHAAS